MLRYYGQCVEVLRTKLVSKKMKTDGRARREGGFIRTEADGERKGRKILWEGRRGNSYMEGQARRRLAGRLRLWAVGGRAASQPSAHPYHWAWRGLPHFRCTAPAQNLHWMPLCSTPRLLAMIPCAATRAHRPDSTPECRKQEENEKIFEGWRQTTACGPSAKYPSCTHRCVS